LSRYLGIFLIAIVILSSMSMLSMATASGISATITDASISEAYVSSGVYERVSVAVGEEIAVFVDLKYNAPKVTTFYVYVLDGYGTDYSASTYSQIGTYYQTVEKGSGVIAAAMIIGGSTTIGGIAPGIHNLRVGVWADEGRKGEPLAHAALPTVEVLEPEMTITLEYTRDEVAIDEVFPVEVTAKYRCVPMTTGTNRFTIELLIGECDDGIYGGDEAFFRRIYERYEIDMPPGTKIVDDEWRTLSHRFEISIPSSRHPQFSGQMEMFVVGSYNQYSLTNPERGSIGGAPYIGEKTFPINVAGESNLKITDLNYVKPPDSIQTGEETSIEVKVAYSDLFMPVELFADIYDAGTGSHLGGKSKKGVTGEGTYTFRPISITPQYAGDWKLRIEVTAETEDERIIAEDEDNIIINVAGKVQQVDVTKIEYVKPPDTIAVGEPTRAVVTVKYSDLAPGAFLQLYFRDVDRDEGITLYTPSGSLEGSGRYTFPAVEITPYHAGDWHLQAVLDLQVSPENYVEKIATEKFTIKVVESQGAVQAEITNIQYTKPPSTTSVGKQTDVTVKIRYENVPPNAKLEVRIYESNNLEHSLDGTLSNPLEEQSGTYTFSPLEITPSKAGDWSLIVKVAYSGRELAREEITIKVVASETATQLQISKVDYVKPPDTIAIGESMPATVAVKYDNLASGTKLSVRIIDESTSREIGSQESTTLSGSGKYTFPAIIIEPTRPGDWRLSVGVSNMRTRLQALYCVYTSLRKTLEETLLLQLQPLCQATANTPSLASQLHHPERVTGVSLQES
jgi:hypothetical protein